METIGRYNVILELITETKKANEGIGAVEKKVGGLGTLFKAAAVGFAGIFSVQALQGMNSKIFEVTKKYQQYATILKVATGSTQEANKVMKMVEETAASTTFSVDELTSSYIMMINRGFKPTKDEIIAIADLAASQGKSFAQLTQAMLNATTGEYEMLKSFGVKVSSVGDKLNLSFKGMNQTVEKTPEAIQKAILALGKMKGVAGSNAEQMNTLNGILSNMGDNAEKIWKNIGERLKKFYTENLGGIAKMVEWLSKITEIPLAEKIQEEQDGLNGLVLAITDVNTSQETRAKLMTELNEKYPFFLEYIGDENASNEELKKGLKEINDLYIKRLMLIGAQQEIDNLSQKQADLEREKFTKDRDRFKDLSKINRELKLGLDLTKYDNIIDKSKAVQSSILTLLSTPGAKNKSQAQYYLEAFDTEYYEGMSKTRSNRIKEAEQAVKEAWDDFYAMEAELKIKLKDIEELFNAGGQEDIKSDDKPKGGDGKKELEAKQKAQLEALEKIYLEKELLAKKEIKNEENLSIRLQEIEYEKNLAILRLKRMFAKDNTKEATELEIQLLDTENAFLDFMYGLANKVPEAANIAKIWQQQAKGLSALKEELDLLVVSLSKLDALGPKAKAIVDVLTGEVSDKVKSDQEKKLQDILNRIRKSNPELFGEGEKKDGEEEKGLLARILGVDNETAKKLESSLIDIKEAVLDVYDLEIRKIDELIDKQQERYDKAKALAEKGKVEQLNIEEARLNALTEKRDKFEKQQRAIASMQIVTAQSVAAAEAIKGAIQSFANKPGIAGIVEGTAYLLAVGAAILSIRNSIAGAFSDIPGFAEGIEAYGVSDNGMVRGIGHGKSDSNLAKLSKGERVVPEEVNRKMGYDFPNARLPEAVHAYRIMPAVLENIKRQSQSDFKIEKLENKLDEVRKSIESLNIVTKLDKDGFVQNIQRSFDEAVRRKKIIG